MRYDDHRSPSAIREQARILRRTRTDAEKRLWVRLRGQAIAGLKFRQQHPIGQYIVDFYCRKVALVIEVDGGIHQEPDHQAADRE